MTPNDWNPTAYARFRGLRLRPALDLLGQLPDLPEGAMVDLGCGAGVVGPVLRTRFGGRRLTGVDSSPAMLEQAAQAGCYDDLAEADIAQWQPAAPPALIFSNAALHWLPDHEALLPRLAGLLAPGGVLAVQVPNQNRAPSHRLWADIRDKHAGAGTADIPGILDPVDYHRLLSPLGQLDLWETEYHQQLATTGEGHPVRRFTQSTIARPYLKGLDTAVADRIVAEYDSVMETIYPVQPDGSVLFPFRRLFFTLRRD
ncbi:methyltransferase domain-containing protein [Pseudooceanicola aestuarii]|uniref:methyltransferase domain-containing protein n=1 Tax=Pseudooceanicola aestuarii TaxID=2697319 RepID=UPI0013D26E76|nr:methyltransferase domain-containing protein [Pseudooceanicola aestuarii]